MHAITHTPGVHRRPSPVCVDCVTVEGSVEGSLGYMGIDGTEVTEVPFFRVVFRYLNYMTGVSHGECVRGECAD